MEEEEEERRDKGEQRGGSISLRAELATLPKILLSCSTRGRNGEQFSFSTLAGDFAYKSKCNNFYFVTTHFFLFRHRLLFAFSFDRRLFFLRCVFLFFSKCFLAPRAPFPRLPTSFPCSSALLRIPLGRLRCVRGFSNGATWGIGDTKVDSFFLQSHRGLAAVCTPIVFFRRRAPALPGRSLAATTLQRDY